MTPMSYVVTKQGEPKIYGSEMWFATTDTVALISCDLDRKGCDVVWTDGFKVIPQICLVDKKNDWTEIQFPVFKGWKIWASDVQGYTLRICFIKP